MYRSIPRPLPLLLVLLLGAALLVFQPAGGVAAQDSRLFGIALGPYTDGSDPNLGATVTEDHLRQLLTTLATRADWVRTYGCGAGLEQVAPIARELGLRVAMGVWIGRNGAANQAQLECGSLAERGQVDLLIVGSEALARHDVSDAQLRDYIRAARARVPAETRIGIADTASALVASTILSEADVVLVNSQPWFAYAGSLETSASEVFSDLARVKAAAPDREVWLGEFGWPTAGAPGASPDEAARFGELVLERLRQEGTPHFWFSFVDEPFKARYGGATEANFGLYTTADNGDLVLKPQMQRLFIDQPAADAQPPATPVPSPVPDVTATPA